MEKNLIAVLGNITAEEFELAIREIQRKRKNDELEARIEIAKEIIASAAEAINELGLVPMIPHRYYRACERFYLDTIDFREPWIYTDKI